LPSTRRTLGALSYDIVAISLAAYRRYGAAEGRRRRPPAVR